MFQEKDSVMQVGIYERIVISRYIHIYMQKTKVGKVNGLSLLLDAETYDYVYPVEVSN